MRVFRFVLVLIAVGGAVFFFGAPNWIRRIQSDFTVEVLAGYEKLIDPEAEPDVEPGLLPYRTGKVVILKPATWNDSTNGGESVSVTKVTETMRARLGRRATETELADDHFAIDAAFRAETPAEASTIIFCERTSLKSAGPHAIDPEKGRAMTAEPPPDAEAIQLTIIDKSGALISRCVVLDRASDAMNLFVSKMPEMPLPENRVPAPK